MLLLESCKIQKLFLLSPRWQVKLDGGIVFFWHQVCNIKMTPVDRRISQENLFFGCVRPRVQILACYSGTAKRHILQSVRSISKLFFDFLVYHTVVSRRRFGAKSAQVCVCVKKTCLSICFAASWAHLLSVAVSRAASLSPAKLSESLE